ncbi:hypothetical protein E3P98_00482 [Wallemia ichthyophaga]|nr:hypothetical protein E3P98_00482 [Wallemia ichthyophaga]
MTVNFYSTEGLTRHKIPQLPEIDPSKPVAPSWFTQLPYIVTVASILFLPLHLRRWIGIPVSVASIIYPLVYLRQPDAFTAYFVGNSQIFAIIQTTSFLSVDSERILVKLDSQGNEKPPPVGLWERFKFVAELIANPRGIHWKWARSIDKQEIEKEGRKTRWQFVTDRLPNVMTQILILDMFETYPYLMQVFHLIFIGISSFSCVNLAYSLTSVVCVVIGLSNPSDWPRFFNMAEAYSIQRLWGIGWHGLFRRSIKFYGDSIGSLFPKYAKMPVKTLVAFSLTGLSHAMGAYVLAGLGLGQFCFFLVQAVGIVVEFMILGNTISLKTPTMKRRLLGYLYTAIFVGVTGRLFLDEFVRCGLYTPDAPYSIIRGILYGQWRV